MNEFQQKVMDRVADLSKSLGVESELVDDVSKYVRLRVSDFTIWIYPEVGADFSSSYYDSRLYERYDFKDEGQLISSFIAELEDAVKRRDYFAAHPQKSPKPLVNTLLDGLNKFVKSVLGR